MNRRGLLDSSVRSRSQNRSLAGYTSPIPIVMISNDWKTPNPNGGLLARAMASAPAYCRAWADLDT
jgi:hypothetical protein